MIRIKTWVSMFLMVSMIVASVSVIGPSKAYAAGLTFLQPVNQQGQLNGDDIAFAISNGSARPETTAHLLIYANDVDEDQGEWDRVFWGNSVAAPELGRLSGQNNLDSTTVFEIDINTIQDDNDVFIRVQNDGPSSTTWIVDVYWAQLVFDGGPAEAAEITELQALVSGSNDDFTLDVDIIPTALEPGSYWLEANVIDETGQNLYLVKQPYPVVPAGPLAPVDFSVPNLPGGVYTVNAILFDYADNEIGPVHHLRSVVVDTFGPVLGGIEFTGTDVQLSPEFDPKTLNYSGNVPHNVGSLTPAFTLPDLYPGETIEASLNGEPYGEVPDEFPLIVGRNTILLKVASPDYPDGNIYTITVDRAPILAAISPTVPAGTTFDPAFDPNDPGTPIYTTVGNDVPNFSFTPSIPDTEEDEGTTIEVRLNGGDFEPADDGALTDELPLVVGRNRIDVRVVSPDGEVDTEYTIYVDREPALDDAVFSSDGDPATTPYVMEPTFDKEQTEYDVFVGILDTEITLTPVADDGETIEYRIDSSDESDYVTVDSEELIEIMNLPAGTTPIDVRVTSPDNVLTKEYTFNVVRDPFLTNLTLSEGDLTPNFSGDVLTYTTNVPQNVSQIAATPTTTDNATIEMRINGAEYVDVDSGNAFGNLPLNYGLNVIEALLTSTDGTTTTLYTMNVYRAYPPSFGGIPYVSSRITAGEDANGQKLLVTDIIGKELSLTAQLYKGNGEALDHSIIRVDSSGNYSLSNIPADTYSMVLTVNGPAGEKLAGQVETITVSGGKGDVEGSLIDPRNKVTDVSTGKALEGVTVTLYWADTELNRSKGRTPGDKVTLPVLTNFAPHKNNGTQLTDGSGLFGWVPFVDGDYYFIAEKEDYATFDSRKDGRNESYGEGSYIRNGTMHIGQSLVKFDFAMRPIGKVTSTGTHEPYMSGYPDGEFKPERGISRAELAAVLTRILPANEVGTVKLPAMNDLSSKHWASNVIRTAREQGWLKGYSDGMFRPGKFVTRAEFAQVIYNIKGSEWAVSDSNHSYNDVNGHWASEAIAAVTAQGLLSTTAGGGSFRPNEALTRAEAVTIFNKLLVRNPQQVSMTPRWTDVPTTYWAYKDIMEASVIHEYEQYDNGVEIWININE